MNKDEHVKRGISQCGRYMIPTYNYVFICIIAYRIHLCYQRHLSGGRLTCLNGLIPPLILRESAAMPAMPSPGSRSCRSEALGWWWVWCGQCAAHALDSGCELWRMILELDVGSSKAGGCMTGHVLTAWRELQPHG